MPGVDSRIDPPSAIESSASDEASQLEIHLQRQLEDDVARIFDESIYTDLEVVSGKLKILTHSCILRARTNKFYHILETILHVNIGRSTFEEIYSFISDTYTECDINHQEKEILNYLKRNPLSFNAKKGGDEPEKNFLPPKSHSPCLEKTLKKSISSSPSTELTKEYYALVPIEGNLLEKELLEQDVLSTAFQSIISSQSEENNLKTQRSKPTSLALISSHTPKSVKHSNSFDISTKSNLKDYLQTDIERNITEKKESVTTSQILKVSSTNDSNKLYDNLHKTLKSCNSGLEKIGDSTYSPDSLITDDPSSSSDYLSAAYTCSPGVSSACAPQFNVQVNIIKMENIFTSSDSGLENTGLLESLTSHKDVTLTDMSLTESTLHDELTDGSNSHDSSPLVEKMKSATLQHDSSQNGTNSQTSENSGKNKELNCNSTKEEKQRQNEEIVILESSSLSSETGSWESVFPPKLPPKKVCEKFLHNERQRIVENDAKPLMNKVSSEHLTNVNEELFRKTAFKSTSCFIDAASLVDEEEGLNEIAGIALVETIPVPSQPVPCSTNKIDMSPNDWSENDNEDSLEQMENKDPDSIQKDLSPTIFEMTPITEDSLCTNAFEQVQQFICEESIPEKSEDSTNTVHMSTTPHNSIMSLKVSSLKNYESEGNESDTTITGRDSSTIIQNFAKYNESSPIISGGASVEDHLPTVGSYSGSPQIRRRIENIPIVSGAYCYAPPEKEEKQNKSPRPACAPAWVVDMSSKGKPEVNRTENKQNVLKKPSDKVCDSLKKSSKNSNDLENCNKSRCSIDSDSSEKSSHKFYIDLSTLPNPTPPKNLNEVDPANEKKNMFSMYIDFGEKSTVKEIPQRLTSLSTKNNNTSDTKNSPKIKNTKVINEPVPVASAKNIDTNSTSIFEKYESLCDDPNISISEIIGFPDKNRKDIKGKPRKDLTSNKGNEFEGRNYYVERSLNPNYGATIHEECVIEQEVEPFVRLSDLDKPVQHVDPDMQKPNKPFGERMTRSIPDSNWCEQQNQSGNSRSNEIISSFHSENAQSLNRLFPHLRNEFSRSMPGSLSSRTRSPMRSEVSSNHGDIEDQTSDTSEMSSMHSSLSRLLDFGTPEESQASSLIGNCQSRLGQDLLRMFLEEIAPDVIVEVSGRRIKAHKCILSSRCQYFAGILSGGWVESAGNVIALPPFSFSVVHFALCHIYSGVSAIPDSISIVELATLADMLGLEGLKEAIMFTLKAKYCHHFHRPCAVCKAGVLECFPLCSVYGMDDLYRKCLKWIIKYLPWVIPTKAFATLPSELLEKCYQEIVINMTLDNVLNTVYSVGLTGVCIDAQEDLTRVRWGEVVLRLCRRVIHAAAHFIAPNLVTMFRSLKDVPADPPPTAKQSLDECMAAAIEWSPADECCRAYQFLFTVTRDMRNHRFAKPDLIKSYPDDNALYAGADSWLLQCEVALVRAAPRVCSTQAFIELPSELRRRLRELGCIMYGGQAQLLVPPPAPPQNRRSAPTVSQPKWQNSSTSRNSEIDRMRAAFIPYASKPVAVTVSTDGLKNSINFQDLKKLSRTIPPTVRTTKAQEERAKFNLSKTIPSQEKPTSKTVTQKPFENTKPRYLEPKTCSENLKKLATPKKYVPKISSSESSRNSSPVQARNLRTSRMKSRPITESNAQALSQDSLVTSSRPRTAEPSTDSLSGSQTSNKYATYTKTKKSNAVKCTKNTTAPNPPAKVKTKIPVYLNSTKLHNTDAKSNGTTRTSTTTTTNSSASLPLRTKVLEKNSCSLMNATKSSSAKMVTKVVTKPAPARTKAAPKGKTTKRTQRHGENDPPTDIPVMERSGTFLKDEPTFGAKTTNIDQDQ